MMHALALLVVIGVLVYAHYRPHTTAAQFDDSRWLTMTDRLVAYHRRRGEHDAKTRPEQAALLRAKAEVRAQELLRTQTLKQRFDARATVQPKITPRLPA